MANRQRPQTRPQTDLVCPQCGFRLSVRQQLARTLPKPKPAKADLQITQQRKAAKR